MVLNGILTYFCFYQRLFTIRLSANLPISLFFIADFTLLRLITYENQLVFKHLTLVTILISAILASVYFLVRLELISLNVYRFNFDFVLLSCILNYLFVLNIFTSDFCKLLSLLLLSDFLLPFELVFHLLDLSIQLRFLFNFLLSLKSFELLNTFSCFFLFLSFFFLLAIVCFDLSSDVLTSG